MLDIGQNLVPGVAVQFAITSAPAGATGQGLSTTSDVTDASGEASTVLTLGNTIGEYQVTATIAGANSVVFSARTTVVVGDANRDFDVNIADLTQVIDHVIGKVMLTGQDSVQADVNKDGVIDLIDIVQIREYLLGARSSFAEIKFGSNSATMLPAAKVASTAMAVSGEFEVTNFGVRFSLKNDVPVKGIQLVMKFRNSAPLGLDSAAITFNRASMMAIPINTKDNEVRIVASNPENIPIEPGEGAIFRFPTQLRNLDGVEEMQLIVSTGEGIHFALRGPVQVLEQPTIPLFFTLEQNFPNPFNPSTTIEFEVPDSPGGYTLVSIEVFNQVGAKVKTLTTRPYEAGRHRIGWNGDDENGNRVASGVYFYRMVSGNFQSAKKMILLK